MSDEHRGTGRTTRQMAALADGSIYIVANASQRDYCRHLLESMGRRHDALRILTGGQVDSGRLRGVALTTDMGIDHAFWELASRREASEVHRFLGYRSRGQALIDDLATEE